MSLYKNKVTHRREAKKKRKKDISFENLPQDFYFNVNVYFKYFLKYKTILNKLLKLVVKRAINGTGIHYKS